MRGRLPALIGVLALLLAAAPPAALAAEGRRPPPEARSAGTLNPPVSRRIVKVIELRDEERDQEALEVLDEIHEMHERDRLNPLETYTMWNFYADLAQRREDYPLALDYFRRMLAVPEMPRDKLEPAAYAVAVLLAVMERPREALEAFERYLELAEDPGPEVFLRIAYLHYQLEDYAEAIPNLLRNMEMLRARGQRVTENTYALLRSCHFGLEDYESFRQVTREMIVLFNQPDDWAMLANASNQLNRREEYAQVLYVASLGGYLDSEGEILGLAFAHSEQEDPFRAAETIRRGIEAGIVEANADNLLYLGQFYQMAREDQQAAEALEAALELEDDPQLHARLAGLYHNLGRFEASALAWHRALQDQEEKAAPYLMSMASALAAADRYEEALQAAREAAAQEEYRDRAQALIRWLEDQQSKHQYVVSGRENLKGYFSKR